MKHAKGDYGAAIAHLREAILHCILLRGDNDAAFKSDIDALIRIFEKLKAREAKAKETKSNE